MSFVIKILILIGAVYLFEKIFDIIDKFDQRDKLALKVDEIGKQFSAFRTKTNQTIDDYQKAYDSLVEKYKDYQSKVEQLISKNDQMTMQIVHYSYEIIEDNTRLFNRLNMVDQFLSSEHPTQEQQDEIVQAIQEDLKLKEKSDTQREEFLQTLKDELGPELEDGPVMGDD